MSLQVVYKSICPDSLEPQGCLLPGKLQVNAAFLKSIFRPSYLIKWGMGFVQAMGVKRQLPRIHQRASLCHQINPVSDK